MLLRVTILLLTFEHLSERFMAIDRRLVDNKYERDRHFVSYAMGPSLFDCLLNHKYIIDLGMFRHSFYLYTMRSRV